MAAVSHIEFFKVTATHPNEGLMSVLKFRLDRIYSFGDISIIVLWSFGLKLSIYAAVSVAHVQNEGLIYFWGRN